MKVLFLTNVPSPYRVDFFNLLSKDCDLTVVYEKQRSSERDNRWVSQSEGTYSTVFLNGISTGPDSTLSFKIKKYLRQDFDRIVICGITTPTAMIANDYCQRHHISFYIESDGGIAKSGSGPKERLKKHLISGASGYMSTCTRNDEYFTTYGASSDCIFRYPFTSIKETDIVRNIPDADQIINTRQKLGIKEDKVVLSIGQFIHRKGFDLLIKAASEMKDLGFYIVGGTPTDEYTGLVKQLGADNVHFEGFKSKEELKLYYDAADVFVLPTREDIWGLVVNEAMSRGLPVITTTNCNAGLEMITDGVNGYLIPTDNHDSIIDAINKYYNSDTDSMRQAALNKANEYTLEKMAQRHIEIFNSER